VNVLAFVQAAPLVIVLVIEAVVWLFFGQLVVMPWLEEQFGGKQPWWKRAALWPARVIRTKVSRLLGRIKADFSQHFLRNSPHFARWLHRQALVLEQLSGVIVASNQATHMALGKLRHDVIPTLIERALAPVRVTLNYVRERVDALEDRNRQVSNAIASTLRALPWGVGGDYVPNFGQWLNSYRHLWTQVFGFIQPQLNQIRVEYLPEIWRRLDDLERGAGGGIGGALQGLRNRVTALETQVGSIILPRLKALEDVLAPAAFAALVLATMTRIAPNLFCRNTTDVTKKLCATDPNLIAQLLAGSLAFALVLDPRLMARLGQEFTGALDDVIRRTADV